MQPVFHNEKLLISKLVENFTYDKAAVENEIKTSNINYTNYSTGIKEESYLIIQ